MDPSTNPVPPTQETAPETPAPTSSPAATPAPIGAHDPGKTLSIVGLVFAFVGLQLIGLILSIVALLKSKKAGFKNVIAIVGIVLNIVFGIVVTGILTSMTIVSYNAITEKAQQAAEKAQQQQQTEESN